MIVQVPHPLLPFHPRKDTACHRPSLTPSDYHHTTRSVYYILLRLFLPIRYAYNCLDRLWLAALWPWR
jgi:hypothetical protein